MSGDWRAADGASIHVVEAMLAGMIILTAILFLSNVSKPSPPAGESGIDLESVARDVLVVLENRPATANPCATSTDPTCHPSRLGQIVDQALGADTVSDRDASNAAGEAFLNDVIPVGNRWLLRLDNGVEPLVILPDSGTNVRLTPRAAKAAEVFLMPAWQALQSDCGTPPAAPHNVPGGPAWTSVTDGDLLYPPLGDVVPPAGSTSWAQWWHAQKDAGDPSYPNMVPDTAMYGWWWHDDGNAMVDSGECHFVGLPDGTATSYPVYGVQLVVWPIAS